MMVFELKTTKGRVFNVFVANKNQKTRLFQKYHASFNSNNEDKFISLKEVCVGIHDISAFEKATSSMNI